MAYALASVDADHEELIRYDIGAVTIIFLTEWEPLASVLTEKLQFPVVLNP